MSRADVTRAAADLATDLTRAGAHVCVPEAEQQTALDGAFNNLLRRGLIVEPQKGAYAANREDVPLLERYANSIAHLMPWADEAAAQ